MFTISVSPITFGSHAAAVLTVTPLERCVGFCSVAPSEDEVVGVESEGGVGFRFCCSKVVENGLGEVNVSSQSVSSASCRRRDGGWGA